MDAVAFLSLGAKAASAWRARAKCTSGADLCALLAARSRDAMRGLGAGAAGGVQAWSDTLPRRAKSSGWIGRGSVVDGRNQLRTGRNGRKRLREKVIPANHANGWEVTGVGFCQPTPGARARARRPSRAAGQLRAAQLELDVRKRMLRAGWRPSVGPGGWRPPRSGAAPAGTLMARAGLEQCELEGPPRSHEKCGTPGGIRTHDLLLRRPGVPSPGKAGASERSCWSRDDTAKYQGARKLTSPNCAKDDVP